LRYRFNLILEDLRSRRTLCQLLCAECLIRLVPRLISTSVERTPQGELDDLKRVTAPPQPVHDDALGGVGW
jgi:hypothetical protein